ncbi:MAG: hypothetical protein RBU37_16520, partial [Myxococcota bacterium]|nr:hypothetical protein [Myxococcota bacterium]
MGLGQKLIGALFQYGGDKLIIAVDDTVTMVSNGQAAPISARAIAQEQFDSIVLELGPEGFTPLPGSSFVYRGAEKPVRGVLTANKLLELTVASDSDSALRMPRLLDPPSNPEISTFPPRPPSSTAGMKEAPTAPHDAPSQADTRSDSPPSFTPPAPPMPPAAPDLQPSQTSSPPSSAENLGEQAKRPIDKNLEEQAKRPIDKKTP